MLALASLNFVGPGVAFAHWPRLDPVEIPHDHDDLPTDHPHVAVSRNHSNPFMIDDLHRRGPKYKSKGLASFV